MKGFLTIASAFAIRILYIFHYAYWRPDERVWEICKMTIVSTWQNWLAPKARMKHQPLFVSVGARKQEEEKERCEDKNFFTIFLCEARLLRHQSLTFIKTGFILHFCCPTCLKRRQGSLNSSLCIKKLEYDDFLPTEGQEGFGSDLAFFRERIWSFLEF